MNRGRRRGDHTNESWGRPSPELLSGLIHRVKLTYRTRVETARRLETRGNTWNFLLVTSALVSSIAGVAQLIEGNIYGDRGAALFAMLGILTMATSLLVTSGNYPVRALLYFRAYRALQRLWAELDANRGMDTDQFSDYEDRYQQMLDEVPNHTQADYYVAYPPRLARRKSPHIALERDDPKWTPDPLRFRKWFFAKARVLGSQLFTYLPVGLGLLVLTALVPTARWIVGG